jgi:hypothetical protein
VFGEKGRCAVAGIADAVLRWQNGSGNDEGVSGDDR